MELGTPAVTGGGSVIAGDCNCSPTITAALKYLLDPYRVCDPARGQHGTSSRRRVKGTIPLKANFDEWRPR